MNALDNIERTLEEWGQNLRGGMSSHGLQPRDVLHTVLSSLEENKVEGLDHRMYVPNTYNVELYLDEEERSRLLPFLGHEEMVAAIQRHAQEHKYQFRGPISVQLVETGYSSPPVSKLPEASERTRSTAIRKKVVVVSRFDPQENWQPEPPRAYSTVPPEVPPLSEHDLDRRDIPSQPTRVYRS